MMLNKIDNLFERFLLLSVVFSLLFVGEVFSQSKVFSPLEDIQQSKKSSETMNMSALSSNDVIPVGNLIDPTAYIVGPTDKLYIQVSPMDVSPVLYVVTADGSIVHKNFGEVNISGLTLKEVRDSLNNMAERRKVGQKVSVSVLQPRMVIVNIRGNVVSPGVYTLPASYSVSSAIRYANQIQVVTGLDKEEISALNKIQELRKEQEMTFSETGLPDALSFSSRNVRVIRRDGKAIIADLERAVATNNATCDPSICEGDIIFVPFEEQTFLTISITGEVIRPATLVYKKGDMASHLLKMGYGFTPDADLNNIRLLTATGEIKIESDSNTNLIGEDVALQPGAAIVVGSLPTPTDTRFGVVAVRGAVSKPNIYVIQDGVTRLSEVINMAGGFTDSAYLPLARVGRRDKSQNDKVSIRRKYYEYFNHSNMTQQDTMRFQMVMDMKSPQVSCDFNAVFNEGKDEQDIVLRDGDVIQVPIRPNRVYVFGQVNNPGYIDFTEGQTMDWYIAKAGGYATSASESRSRIIRGGNRVWVDGFQDSTYVYDGDEVFVPSPRDVPPEMELQKWAAYTGMTAAVTSFITLIYGIFKK